jgi:hypothetical protein
MPSSIVSNLVRYEMKKAQNNGDFITKECQAVTKYLFLKWNSAEEEEEEEEDRTPQTKNGLPGL